uniref:glucose-6-phosphate 1-epimerase n=1 Tax=mine drainage metagenome TaxID=410659 RepID=E6PLR5_9ZZZZ
MTSGTKPGDRPPFPGEFGWQNGAVIDLPPRAMQDLSSLRAFAIPGQLSFRAGAGGLVFADIDNPGGSASIALQGAHLTGFHPKAQREPVVWLSEKARFAPGKSIRGGVPVCWPWFGAHASEPTFPAHGFARTVPWEVVDSGSADGATTITLRLVFSDATHALWPHDTPVELRISVADALALELTTLNAGEAPVPLGEALHSYFHVGDIAEVELRGLDGCAYLDKTEAFARKQQSGPLRFAAETDRVYVDTRSTCVIDDVRLRRRIHVAKQGSASTVVWTPWADKAAAMGDYTAEGWRSMLCVESANAADNALTLQPGEAHVLAVRYSAEAL